MINSNQPTIKFSVPTKKDPDQTQDLSPDKKSDGPLIVVAVIVLAFILALVLYSLSGGELPFQ